MLSVEEIYDTLEGRRKELGLSQAAASKLMFGRADSSFFQGLRRGSMPSAARLATAYTALGLRSYFETLAPRQGVAKTRADRATWHPDGKETNAFRHPQKAGATSSVQEQPAAPAAYAENTPPLPAYAFDPDTSNVEHVLVPKLDIRLAAGHGASTNDERPVGMLAFRHDWMRRNNLQPGQVSAVEVMGDSMEPSFKDGDTVLVDHRRSDYQRGKVVAARVDDELFIKRLESTPNNNWLLISDNHNYAPLELTPGDAIIGAVVWRGTWV